jgi:hypothetical protein
MEVCTRVQEINVRSDEEKQQMEPFGSNGFSCVCTRRERYDDLTRASLLLLMFFLLWNTYGHGEVGLLIDFLVTCQGVARDDFEGFFNVDTFLGRCFEVGNVVFLCKKSRVACHRTHDEWLLTLTPALCFARLNLEHEKTVFRFKY